MLTAMGQLQALVDTLPELPDEVQGALAVKVPGLLETPAAEVGTRAIGRVRAGKEHVALDTQAAVDSGERRGVGEGVSVTSQKCITPHCLLLLLLAAAACRCVSGWRSLLPPCSSTLSLQPAWSAR